MKKQILNQLSRRERQIMDIIYQKGEATAAEVHKDLPDPPSYSAVRALLTVLEEKGIVKHDRAGRAYLYRPTVTHNQVRDSALKQVVQTFFDGSIASVVASLVNMSDKSLNDEEFQRLEALVKEKRKQKRKK